MFSAKTYLWWNSWSHTWIQAPKRQQTLSTPLTAPRRRTERLHWADQASASSCAPEAHRTGSCHRSWAPGSRSKTLSTAKPFLSKALTAALTLRQFLLWMAWIANCIQLSLEMEDMKGGGGRQLIWMGGHASFRTGVGAKPSTLETSRAN